MKNFLIAAAALVVLTSCSDEDHDVPNEPFFNLAEGNEWIYDRYYVDESSGYSYSDYRDSVRVEGQEIIDGLPYYIVNHYGRFNSSEYRLDMVEKLRVDSNGHLVYQNGKIIHPGTDTSVQGTYDYIIEGDIIGQLQYSLEPQTQLSVEGHSYNVYPYLGYFTSSGQQHTPDGLGEVTYYQPGLGLVLHKARIVGSSDYFREYRLISYNVQ